MPQLPPSSPDTSRRMAKVRQKGTDAEVALRREMYRIGLRYRIDYEVLKRPRRVADVAFPGRKIAIFVDGCFWHRCPDHGTAPKNNGKWWADKLDANVARDRRNDDELRKLGWTTVHVWEHEDPAAAAEAITKLWRSRLTTDVG